MTGNKVLVNTVCGKSTDHLIDWLVGWLIGRLVGWLVGWLIDWLIDWLIGCWSNWLIVMASHRPFKTQSALYGRNLSDSWSMIPRCRSWELRWAATHLIIVPSYTAVLHILKTATIGPCQTRITHYLWVLEQMAVNFLLCREYVLCTGQ